MTAELNDLQSSFRTAMASVCTPVSVVTTVEDGRPHGTTVSAFTSLSMTPPMVLVSLDRGSDLLSMVERTGTFGLNVLTSAQSGLALRFARKGADKFDGVAWSDDFGAARLGGEVQAWVACTVGAIVEGGDHMVLLGDVVSAEATETEPLTYHARTFGTHLRHVEVS
jgi:flavin reductase (DIM6/NTAB) family NADH-FMN oxidoreductase RutF